LTRRPRSGGIAGVPKYDAFGREIGEDTLKGLGGAPAPAPAESSWEARTDREEASWQAAEQVEVARQQAAADAADAQAERTEDARQEAAGESRYTATPRPTFVRPGAEGAQRQAQAAATRASSPTVRRRSSGRGCLVVVVILVAVFSALAAIGAIVDSVDVKSGSTSGGTTTAIPEAVKPKPAPKGLGPGSLVRQDSFAAALKQIRTQGGGRLTNLRVAPERIDAQLLTAAGRLRSVQVTPGGKLERFGPDSGAGFDQSTTIPFARINTAAPQRLARAGAERIGVKVATLQYLVPTTFNGSVAWAAYFTRGRYVIGDASGRFKRKYP
jgi:hypothetical protein